MAELPTGTVTFLFSDVEGSTRLLHEHGERYAELLAEHRLVLRNTFATYRGVEVDTQGDAFFVAFARASDALAAAREAQAALEPTPVRVRMGLHTGEPRVTGEGYVGIDVHVGARIAAAGHGGQVLVSEQTARLLGSESLVDLGRHRLKDVGELRLFQAGEGAFPPPRTLNATNLPLPPTPLLGRKKELADVLRLLRVERSRLVTVTGPGGIGKTRFALEAAAELVDAFADGVFLVDLSPLRDPALVQATIAQTLGAQGELAQWLGGQEVLLVLDNLEQVVESAPDLAALLARCPALQLLTTSREPLRVAGEREYPLRPLAESPAIELFRQRAEAHEPSFDGPYELLAEICDRLDRLPLALELAAARTKVLSPEELLARLDRRLPLLTGRARDLPERQRTLSRTIAWSHELLDEDERRLFRRLAIFAGGCTVESAEHVAEAGFDTLESLVDKSLLQHRGSRFAMLETIREYALEQLEASSEVDAVRRRHAEFFLELTESAAIDAEPGGVGRHGVVREELDDVRSALEWSLEHDPELGLRLMVALEGFWPVFNPIEAMRWFELLLDRADGVPLELRAHALRAYGGVANPAGRDDVAEPAYAESLEAFRALGDAAAAAVLLLRLGYAAFYRGDLGRARSLAEESLAAFSPVGNRRGESQALGLLGEVEYAEKNHPAGLELMERSAALAGEEGFTWWRAGMLGKLADCTLREGLPEEAAAHAREALALSRELADRLRIVRGLARLAGIAARLGDAERAGRLWGAVEAEEARGRVGAWENERERFERPVLALAGAALERGLEGGRTLSLSDAVEEALADA